VLPPVPPLLDELMAPELELDELEVAVEPPLPVAPPAPVVPAPSPARVEPDGEQQGCGGRR
jgi:hypothetical protein